VSEALTREVLDAAHCWEPIDRVPGQPELTDFRRRLRLHQARWREAHGHPIGSQPMVPQPGKPTRLVGSRLDLAYAQETGATLLTPAALDAAKARMAITEREQSLSAQRLWADLLSSTALSFNLFGDLAADLALADRAVHAWWPDAPGTVSAVRFAHSPGRLDPAFIGNLCAFDVAIELDLGDGTLGFIGVATPYHDVNRPQPPKPQRLARYVEVTERSGTHRAGTLDAVNGTRLIHIWLDHMLVHSMLQHPSGRWRWGNYAVIHPAGNTDFVEACATYRGLLADASTFSSTTLESCLDGGGLPDPVSSGFRSRYLPG